MKKALLILVLSGSFGYAQEFAANIVGGKDVTYNYSDSQTANEKLLKKEDFNLKNGRMLVTSLACKIQNEESSDTILVSVVCQQKAFNELGVDKINDMILVANEKIRSSLNANFRYNPQEIKMAYIPDSHDWSMTNSFTVQDADGLVKEKLLAVDFDINGKFAGMKNIF